MKKIHINWNSRLVLNTVVLIFVLGFGGYLWVQADKPMTQASEVAEQWTTALCDGDETQMQLLTYGVTDAGTAAEFYEATKRFRETIEYYLPCSADVQESSLDKLPVPLRAQEEVAGISILRVTIEGTNTDDLSKRSRDISLRVLELNNGQVKVLPTYWPATNLIGAYQPGETALLEDTSAILGDLTVTGTPSWVAYSETLLVGIPVNINVFGRVIEYFDLNVVLDGGYIMERASDYDVPDDILDIYLDHYVELNPNMSYSGVFWFKYEASESLSAQLTRERPNVYFTVNAHTDYWDSGTPLSFELPLETEKLNDRSTLATDLPLSVVLTNSILEDGGGFTLNFSITVDVSERDSGWFFDCSELKLILTDGQWLEPRSCPTWQQSYYAGDPPHVRAIDFGGIGSLEGAVLQYRTNGSVILWDYSQN
ncbi:MAG: hypothetical protein ACOZAO_05250 [Patescibacteria group bacterium]